jgi:hypothetical protein
LIAGTTIAASSGRAVDRLSARFRRHSRTLAHHRVLFLDDPLEGLGLSAENSAALHAIMAVGSQERLEFLG